MRAPSIRGLVGRLAACAAAMAAVMAFIPAARADASAVTPQFVPYLQFGHDFRKCLDVAGQVNGSTVQQLTCNGTVNQQWTKQPTDNGWFRPTVASRGSAAACDGPTQV